MAVLALLVGGGFVFQFMRKNDIEELNEEDDEEEIDLEIGSIPIAEINGNTNNTTFTPRFGVPCFNWGGLDNGHRLKGEIPVGVADTSRSL